MMKRILEPELMEEREQAEAYAAADFAEADRLMIEAFTEYFPDTKLDGTVLDLGCGPGNIAFRFAERFPGSRLIGVDGSSEMLRLANRYKDARHDISGRIRFVQGIIPEVSLPSGPYAAIVSNSFLHHLHRPEVLWQIIKQYATKGCKILVMDLFRPDSNREARDLVERYAGNEPEILRRDFYNSLLAALTPVEVERQLAAAGLTGLAVRKVSDRHQIIVGEKK